MVRERVAKSAQESIVCRPVWTVLMIGIALFGVTFLCIMVAMESGRQGALPALWQYLFFGSCAALSFVAAVYYVLGFFRSRVTADAHGIRWRGIGTGWHSATWDDVRDYYYAPAYNFQRSSKVLVPNVVTAQGVVRVSPDTSNESSVVFQNIVQSQATQARVRDWVLLGIRRVDEFPRTFRYWNRTVPWQS